MMVMVEMGQKTHRCQDSRCHRLLSKAFRCTQGPQQTRDHRRDDTQDSKLTCHRPPGLLTLLRRESTVPERNCWDGRFA